VNATRVVVADERTGPEVVTSREGSLRLTAGETAVLATSPVQRMARLRQTGLAYLTAPCSEHTRLVHCLGTTYWTDRIFGSIEETDGAAARLNGMDACLGGDDAALRIARLLALVHDCSLLPLGHTIKHQLGFSHRKTSVLGLLLECASRIRQECSESAEWYGLNHPGQLEADLRLTEWAVAAAQLAAGKRSAYRLAPGDRAAFIRALPALWFIVDVVTGPLSADLFDYAGRDLPAVNVGFEMPAGLLESLRIVEWKPDGAAAEAIGEYLEVAEPPAVFRLGVELGPGAKFADALSTAIAARFRIAEKIWFESEKMVADAMLDVALRRIDAVSGEVSNFGGPFEPARLLEIGDDAFLSMIEFLERPLANGEGVVPNLVRRRLYTNVARMAAAELPGLDSRAAGRLASPAERNRLEEILRQAVGDPKAPLCVSCVPADAQFKAADVLVRDSDGHAGVLEEIAAEREELQPVAALRGRYAALWSVAVMAPPPSASARTAEVCRNVLTHYFQGGAA
jgi:HD superfamily phosphohydrolase